MVLNNNNMVLSGLWCYEITKKINSQNSLKVFTYIYIPI